VLFIDRMAKAIAVEADAPLVERDRADGIDNSAEHGDAADRDTVVYRISGAFFFGTAAAVSAVLDRLAEHPKAYVIDVSAVPVLDSTAAATVEGFVRKAHRHGAIVFIAGARPPIRRVLLFHGVRPPRVRFRTGLAEAVTAARARNGADGPTEESPEAATA
jgi:SulP family sulfate permease